MDKDKDKSLRDNLDPDQQRIWDIEDNTMAFEIARKRVETGLTFSSEAFDQYLASITQFIGTRVMRHWEETGEPPTIMRTVVSVAVDHAPADQAQEKLDSRPERVALKLLKDLIEIHSKIQMDTPEDKALHAKVVQNFSDGLKILERRIP